jgi:arginyl-tRNA--protein-N-Asp/Glu arginylyltransferase
MNSRSQEIGNSASLGYDERCRSEFRSLQSRLGHLFIDIDIGCPYGLPYVSTFHQATFGPLSERAMELFLAAGYRRNGNCLYNMACAACSACIPIRLHPAEFRANRNQRRVLAKNRDIDKALTFLQPADEDLKLCEKFLRARYPRENNTAKGYFRDFFLNVIVNSAQLQYRADGRLLGASIIDIGYNWLNAVYFFFDPEESRRSLGTYNILSLIDLCREWEIEFLYLGYYIRSVPAMSYKANFHPHYLLVGKDWQRRD